MKIWLVNPASEPALASFVTGNDVTANRWENILRKLGHKVLSSHDYDGASADVLIALHARKSAPAIERFSNGSPGKPLVVVLTGTDLYEDLPDNPVVADSLSRATHVIALQPGALDRLDATIRPKTSVIYQSAQPLVPAVDKPADCFQICLVAHLRSVKDPFLAAEAATKLPEASGIRVVHAGAAATEAMRQQVDVLTASEARYRWVGPLPHDETRRLIAGSHVLLLTSRSEGGANVLSEALALGVPILASRVHGVEGFLGNAYPGYFPARDADRLAEQLYRAERDEVFYRRLELACEKLSPMVSPAWEYRSWQQLLNTMI